MRPKATAQDGRCSECGGRGTVITIEADPLPVSLCLSCLAWIMAGATGIRSAVVEQWRR